MKEKNRPIPGLPSLEKVIEQAKKLKESGADPAIKIVVHPNGFNLSIDELDSPNPNGNPKH